MSYAASPPPAPANVTRRVSSGLVSVAGVRYACAGFVALEGRNVRVRPVDRSANQLHVFVDGASVGDAHRIDPSNLNDPTWGAVVRDWRRRADLHPGPDPTEETP